MPFLLCAIAGIMAASEDAVATSTSQPDTVQVVHPDIPTLAPEASKFTVSFTADDLVVLLEENTDALPMSLQLVGPRREAIAALERVSMRAVVEVLKPVLLKSFPDQFDAELDIIIGQVSDANQITLDAPDLPEGSFSGPSTEIVGFILRDISAQQYINVAVLVIERARQLVSSGKPSADRQAEDYYRLAARAELDTILEARTARFEERQSGADVRERVGRSLGIIAEDGTIDESRAEWVKESRRFSYVVKGGQYITKLQPVVDRINHDIALSGWLPANSIDTPGIHFDAELNDVEILLPKDMLTAFLTIADDLEQRMAEDAVISIEVVRLTDRDIIDGVVAMRMNASFQAVHDVQRGNSDTLTATDFSVNSLAAVANGFSSGDQVARIRGFGDTNRRVTNIGSSATIGADDVFFDGREQSYGFSYIGPDGLRHRISRDVADSLRMFWERVERNLILHKIRKTDQLEKFSVPVGPETKVFEGLAALIQQQTQQQVVATGTGALATLSATAGTWLVLKGFDIVPIPGSSTALTSSEATDLDARVLMTMVLRDPLIDIEVKRGLLQVTDRNTLEERLRELGRQLASRVLRLDLGKKTFGSVYKQRLADALIDAAIKKREKNSKIVMTFFSSQGVIQSEPGVTALGDSNDLTSFTTEVTPNRVTAISSFFTKNGSSTRDMAATTRLPRGENFAEEKSMSHLVLRARLPTKEGQRRNRDEGRFLGYFDLPSDREEPLSTVHLPFLDNAEHPLIQLAQITPGLIFDTLNRKRVKQIKRVLNPQRLVGDVSIEVWRACTTRWSMMSRLISESTHKRNYVQTANEAFIVTVRSLLEYDEDFFDAPNVALFNMAHWNDSARITRALYNSTDRFALEQLTQLVDELSVELITEEFVQQRLAVASSDFWGNTRIRDLTAEEIAYLRRDVAIHIMREEEFFGDAFLEAAANILGLGTYESRDSEVVTSGPFRGYEDLVVFDLRKELYRTPQQLEQARQQFYYLRDGGYNNGWGHSFVYLKHLDPQDRKFIIRGAEIIDRRDMATANYVQE